MSIPSHRRKTATAFQREIDQLPLDKIQFSLRAYVVGARRFRIHLDLILQQTTDLQFCASLNSWLADLGQILEETLNLLENHLDQSIHKLNELDELMLEQAQSLEGLLDQVASATVPQNIPDDLFNDLELMIERWVEDVRTEGYHFYHVLLRAV